MPIDYSKFDNIEDSDDEREKNTASTSTTTTASEKPHCHNCHKDVEKPLRCGVCKKVSYCSAKCQKDDWSFHKRVCKKPEPPKDAKAKPEARKQPSSETRSKKAEEKVVVDDEENISWYRHREWKPTEPKQEFRPTQITAEEAGAATSTAVASASERRASAGSVWNSAGTWEEKDVTALAQQTLKDQLRSVPSVDIAGGMLSATLEGEVDGDASKPVIRGTLRHIFDLSFKMKVLYKWMDSNGQRTAEGFVKVSDFTNDTFAELVLTPPVVELSFRDSKAVLEEGRQHGVQQAIGSHAWPPPAGSLMANVSARMEAWAKEYSQG